MLFKHNVKSMSDKELVTRQDWNTGGRLYLPLKRWATESIVPTERLSYQNYGKSKQLRM
jgi:hypothetical protein